MLQHLKTSGKAVGTGILLSLLIASGPIFTGCSSTPEVQEFPATANASREISNLERNINKARSEQVDVLAPNHFKRAEKSLKKSIEARDDNDKNEDILREVAVGNAWLVKANDVARKGADAIPDIVDVRSKAIDSRADVHARKALRSADDDLKDLGEDFEDGKYTVKDKTRQDLLAEYMDIELASIKAEKLGYAVHNIEQAEKEGAKKAAPHTFALAQKRLKDAEAFITANRHDTEGIEEVASVANREADRVLRITREAKVNRNKTPEQIALEMENERLAQQQLNRDLDLTQRELSATETALGVVSAESSQLSEQVALDEKIKQAKEQFDENEAEVYRDGDNLLIRLKGLQFPSGQADLAAASYPIMTKVQGVIKSMGDVEVQVEGHTDAVGSKELNDRLSEMRADAVKNYLVENGAVEEARISAAGYGYERPITTNKTRQGRAENRRVDIIVTPQ